MSKKLTDFFTVNGKKKSTDENGKSCNEHTTTPVITDKVDDGKFVDEDISS